MTVTAGGSLKALRGMVPLCLLSGIAFFVPEFIVASVMGPELAVVAGSIVTMGVIVGYATKFPVNDPAYAMEMHEEGAPVTRREGLIAWLPFIFIFLFLLVTSKLIPVLHDPLTAIQSSVLIYDGPGGAPYTFVWVATPGVLIFLASFLGGHVQGASMAKMLGTLKETVIGLRFTIVTIITVIATAKVMGYAGMTHQIAETAVAATGTAYPLVAAFIGSIGTCSSASSRPTPRSPSAPARPPRPGSPPRTRPAPVPAR